MMATQYAIDEALAILHRWLDAGGPRAKSNVENDALRDAVEIALGAYRELRQRDANVTTILIEAIARGVELRKVGADGTAPEPHNARGNAPDTARTE
jgi:hypothetical protein